MMVLPWFKNNGYNTIVKPSFYHGSKSMVIKLQLKYGFTTVQKTMITQPSLNHGVTMVKNNGYKAMVKPQIYHG